MVKELDTAESIQFPFLGLRSDGEPFQYLPSGVKGNFLQVSIYNWFVNRVFLNVDETVDLLIPDVANSAISSGFGWGVVKSATPNPAQQSTEYEIDFGVEISQISMNNWVVGSFSKDVAQQPVSVPSMIKQYVKDTKLLKAGVRIYLKHIKAYFSRISPYNPEEYAEINKILITDIEMHVRKNEDNLNTLYLHLEQGLKHTEDIPAFLDLEQFREMIESEISLPLLTHVFSEGKHLNSQGLPIISQMKHPCIAYLAGIKSLERRLYVNYNMVVMLYAFAVKTSLSAL